MRDAAGAVGNGHKRSSLGTGTRDDCRLPGDMQVESDEGATAQKEETEVAWGSLER